METKMLPFVIDAAVWLQYVSVSLREKVSELSALISYAGAL